MAHLWGQTTYSLYQYAPHLVVQHSSFVFSLFSSFAICWDASHALGVNFILIPIPFSPRLTSPSLHNSISKAKPLPLIYFPQTINTQVKIHEKRKTYKIIHVVGVKILSWITITLLVSWILLNCCEKKKKEYIV